MGNDFTMVRPAKAADFNGTVIVHWQNVTAGYELGIVSAGEYLGGYAWVGVSACVHPSSSQRVRPFPPD